ncbi:MAG TPA: NAD(P)-dependent oxidoreductase, partial [Chitinophagaceae bacterium]|nr:NAD(P)-dependent oxidoreductase [Chitinophagaceae bacterium]
MKTIVSDLISDPVETADTGKNRLFPVFLKLEHLNVLLVGAGKVGLEKLEALVNNAPAARVHIVAPHILAEVRAVVETHPTL